MSGEVTLRVTTNDVSDRALSKKVDSMVEILGGFGDVEIVDEKLVNDLEASYASRWRLVSREEYTSGEYLIEKTGLEADLKIIRKYGNEEN